MFNKNVNKNRTKQNYSIDIKKYIEKSLKYMFYRKYILSKVVEWLVTVPNVTIRNYQCLVIYSEIIELYFINILSTKVKYCVVFSLLYK